MWLVLVFVSVMRCDGTCGTGQPSFSVPCDFPYPLQYVTYYTDTPPVLDGLLNEELWRVSQNRMSKRERERKKEKKRETLKESF